jgi:spoIIIJ-associated protein
MSDSEFTGKTIDDAIEEGLKQLNLTREMAEITVIDEPSKGIIRSKKAKVKIIKKLSDGSRAIEFIDELLEKMNFLATGELIEEDEKIIINLITTNSSSIIGYRGEVLDAFQTLAGAVANTGREDYKRVVVDCENYRGKREETLKNLALRLAEKAVAKARKVTLEPMNPYERRIIHSALSENTEVKTISEGKEPNRFIAIIPNNARPYERNNRFDKNRNDSRNNSCQNRGSGGFNRGSGFSRERSESSAGGYNKDRTSSSAPYSRDRNESSSFNKERTNSTGYNKDRNESSEIKPKKTTTFGTYLGNSFKD